MWYFSRAAACSMLVQWEINTIAYAEEKFAKFTQIHIKVTGLIPEIHKLVCFIKL